MIDWDAAWDHYRFLGDPILVTFLPEVDAPLIDAADLLHTIRAGGGRVEANGELAWPVGHPGLCEEDAERWPEVWPHARELLAFERQLEHDLAEVTRG